MPLAYSDVGRLCLKTASELASGCSRSCGFSAGGERRLFRSQRTILRDAVALGRSPWCDRKPRSAAGRARERAMPRKPGGCTKNHRHGPRKPSGCTAPISASHVKPFPCAVPTRPMPRKPGGCTRIHNRRPKDPAPCTSRHQLVAEKSRPLYRRFVQRSDFLGISQTELVQNAGFLGKDRRSEVQPAAFLGTDSEPLVQRASFLGRGWPNVVQKAGLLGIGQYGPIASPTARPSTNGNKRREERRGEAFPKVELWHEMRGFLVPRPHFW